VEHLWTPFGLREWVLLLFLRHGLLFRGLVPLAPFKREYWGSGDELMVDTSGEGQAVSVPQEPSEVPGAISTGAVPEAVGSPAPQKLADASVDAPPDEAAEGVSVTRCAIVDMVRDADSGRRRDRSGRTGGVQRRR